MRLIALASAFALTTFVVGCASSGPFTWYSEVPKTEWNAAFGEYVVGVGDVISIRVYDQDALSVNGKIRRDGRIAIPLVGEVIAAGKHPRALAAELEAKLKPFVVTPRVTVNVEQSQPVTVSTLGEIKTIGILTLEPPAGIVQALAQSGGLTEFGDESRIFVLRQFPSFQRIRFTYDAILENEGGAALFPLRTGDVIVVE